MSLPIVNDNKLCVEGTGGALLRGDIDEHCTQEGEPTDEGHAAKRGRPGGVAVNVDLARRTHRHLGAAYRRLAAGAADVDVALDNDVSLGWLFVGHCLRRDVYLPVCIEQASHAQQRLSRRYASRLELPRPCCRSPRLLSAPAGLALLEKSAHAFLGILQRSVCDHHLAGV